MLKLSRLFDFVGLLDKFRSVERAIYVENTDRRENDAEHSYNLAMLAWYIAEGNNLDLDRGLILKYALVHDLVEAYAGDTFLFAPNGENNHDNKADREKKAKEKLLANFSEFGDLREVINGYEKKETPESRFVYALDKIIPIFNVYNDNGRLWKEQKVTLEMIIDFKKDKVAMSPEIEPYFNELIALLKENKKEVFWTEKAEDG